MKTIAIILILVTITSCKKKEKEVYAMKEMSKARVMAKKSVQSVMNELKLLSQMRSPYACLTS